MNYPVNCLPAILYRPSVKAFKLFQTVCRAGSASNLTLPGEQEAELEG